jgi:hypothetical protein
MGIHWTTNKETTMKSMLASLAIQVYGGAVGRYGFAGINGLFGLLVGLIVFIVIVAVLFKIVKLLLPALGVGEPWATIIYWVMVLIVFLAFLHFFGLY